MRLIWIGCASAALTFSTDAMAQELNYRLPRTTMIAAWQARLTHCPTSADREVRYDTKAIVAGAPVPGELVRLNPASPFLGSRKVSLTFHDSGNLKGISAEGKGQGGTILAGIVKSVAGLAALPVSGLPAPAGGRALDGTPIPTPPPSPAAKCSTDIENALKSWVETSNKIRTIEADVIAGTPLGAERVAMLTQLKQDQADLEKALTLTTGVKLNRARQTLGDKTSYAETATIPPIDLKKWLVGSGIPAQKTGKFGFCAIFAASADDVSASKPIATRSYKRWHTRYVDGFTLKRALLNRFVYRTPVPTTVTLYPRAANDEVCTSAVPDGRKTLESGTVPVPQFSDYFILPIGSGAFESKASNAEFADDGRIVSIGTNNTGGGTQFAEALAGVVEGAETMQGAKTAAIQRRIDRIKAENELAELLKLPAAPPPADGGQ